MEHILLRTWARAPCQWPSRATGRMHRRDWLKTGDPSAAAHKLGLSRSKEGPGFGGRGELSLLQEPPTRTPAGMWWNRIPPVPALQLTGSEAAAVPSRLQQQARLLNHLPPTGLWDKHSVLLNPTSGLAVLFHYLQLRGSSPELLNDPREIRFRIFLSSSFAKKLLVKKTANNHICSAIK